MLKWLRGLVQSTTSRRITAKIDVAQTTNQNSKHWANADGLSSRAALSPEVRRIVRLRSRYEAENNSWYAGILRTAVNHIVGGPGPRLQVLTSDVMLNRRIEKAWQDWCRRVDFVDTLRVAVEAYWRDGECYMMRAEKPRQYPISLDVRLFEADQIAAPWDSAVWKDDYQDDGIRFDRETNELMVYVYDHHPGGNVWSSNLSGQWYPAKSVVAHLFRAERPGQVHGIPRATPSLQTLPIMRRQELATLLTAETAANFGMYLKTNGVTPAALPSGADFATMEMARNMVTMLPEGWDIGQVDPKQPGPQYEMFQRQALMSFCRCTNMPYTLAAGTGKDANFSSFKGDMRNVWEPEVKVEQNRIDVMILGPVFNWFLESAVFYSGLLSGAPPIDQIAYSFQWPPLPELDVMESAQAAELRLKTGQSTMSFEYSRRGDEWEPAAIRGAADLGMTVDEYKRRIADSLIPVATPETTTGPTESVVTNNTTAVADTAMNGAQVTSIVEIISQVGQKMIPVATAKALIRSAFPAINPANIEEMLAPFASLTPSVPGVSADMPTGEYTELSQRAFKNNQKRIIQTLNQVKSGEMSQVMAEQTLASIGLTADRIFALIQDALDGQVDDPELQQVTR